MALLTYATKRPSALMAGDFERPVAGWVGFEACRLTRVTPPVTRSKRKTSLLMSVSVIPATSPVERLSNATNRPSALMEGLPDPDVPVWTSAWLEWLTSQIWR